MTGNFSGVLGQAMLGAFVFGFASGVIVPVGPHATITASYAVRVRRKQSTAQRIRRKASSVQQL